MPKFVNGSSGQIYGKGRSNQEEEEDELALIAAAAGNQKDSIKKPSAINKKGTKEQQKSSLDLFKEELRRLNEEREGQRNKLKRSITDASLASSQDSPVVPVKVQPVPVPLKPDPRCPTTLTLQVNLNPKDKDSSIGGSFDNGDPSTTNLYVGNLNPSVNENDLCDIFGKFGPLASIKIMWPRTDEEKARNRNSGFVAYMSRVDALRALKALNGKEFRTYDMKLGWGKTVPIPQNPVYVPPELLKLQQPPPKSGMPFNGQLHEDDVKRNYVVPNPFPRPVPAELQSQIESDSQLQAMNAAYHDFIEVVQRSTVKVVIPSDREMLDRIHKTIEYVIKEGPVFEAIIIARENKNPAYSFLYDNRSYEHVYYRWKLYSILHGDDPYLWRTEEFRMFEGGPLWKPPPLNPYADGMPEELIKNVTGPSLDVVDGFAPPKKRTSFIEGSLGHEMMLDDSRPKGSLGAAKRETLGDILRNLDPTKRKIGSAMIFCINHADAAEEIIECIYESLRLLETPFQKKVARLFLVSDILHNCSAAVTNASYYREGFQAKLMPIFEHLREYLINIEDRYKADKFKQQVLSVLGAWKEWTLYEDELILRLSNILLGIKPNEDSSSASGVVSPEALFLSSNQRAELAEDHLDGEEIDEETLAKCLEAKGLSLRWYMTMELSEDEEDSQCSSDTRATRSVDRSPSSLRSSQTRDNITAIGESSGAEKIRFKTSKWETVDPNEVAGQVVTISKWESAPQKSPSSDGLPER